MYQIDCSGERMEAFQEVLNTLCNDMREYGLEEDARVLESLREVIEGATPIKTVFLVEGKLDDGARINSVKIAVLAESEDKAIRAARKEVQTDSDTYLTVEKTSQFTGPLVSTD